MLDSFSVILILFMFDNYIRKAHIKKSNNNSKNLGSSLGESDVLPFKPMEGVSQQVTQLEKSPLQNTQNYSNNSKTKVLGIQGLSCL